MHRFCGYRIEQGRTSSNLRTLRSRSISNQVNDRICKQTPIRGHHSEPIQQARVNIFDGLPAKEATRALGADADDCEGDVRKTLVSTGVP